VSLPPGKRPPSHTREISSSFGGRNNCLEEEVDPALARDGYPVVKAFPVSLNRSTYIFFGFLGYTLSGYWINNQYINLQHNHLMHILFHLIEAQHLKWLYYLLHCHQTWKDRSVAPYLLLDRGAPHYHRNPKENVQVRSWNCGKHSTHFLQDTFCHFESSTTLYFRCSTSDVSANVPPVTDETFMFGSSLMCPDQELFCINEVKVLILPPAPSPTGHYPPWPPG
jgi:hypothetical protein